MWGNLGASVTSTTGSVSPWVRLLSSLGLGFLNIQWKGYMRGLECFHPHHVQLLPWGSLQSVLGRHQENRALCGRLETDNLKGNGGRRIEAFLLWRKAWAAGREPETTDITIILGTGLWEVGGSLREWAELPGEGMEGLSLAQEQQAHLRERALTGSADRQPWIWEQEESVKSGKSLILSVPWILQ